MSLVLAILLIWVAALLFALLEGTLQKNKKENLAKIIHLAVLGLAIVLVGKVFLEFVSVMQGFAIR